MKRLFNSEKVIVAAAMLAAVSLLASACGRNTMKTLKEGSKVFTGDVNLSAKDKNTQAIQQKREKDVKEGNAIPTDLKSSEELASRISYIVYEETQKDGKKLANLRLEMRAKNNKKYIVDFAQTAIANDKSIILTENTAREKDNEESTAIELPVSAQLNSSEHGRSIITITETSVDAKKVETIAQVNALIIISKAKAEVESQDTSLLKMKDASIRVRMTQLFIYDDTQEDGKIKILQSDKIGANRVAIDVRSKETDEEIYSLVSRLLKTGNKHNLYISRIHEELAESFRNENVTMEITNVDTEVTIESTVLEISVKDKKTQDIKGKIMLSLYDEGSLEAAIRDNSDDKKDQPTSPDKTAVAPAVDTTPAAIEAPAAAVAPATQAEPTETPLVMPAVKKEDQPQMFYMPDMIIRPTPELAIDPITAPKPTIVAPTMVIRSGQTKSATASKPVIAKAKPETAKAAAATAESNKSKYSYKLGVKVNGVIITSPSPR